MKKNKIELSKETLLQIEKMNKICGGEETSHASNCYSLSNCTCPQIPTQIDCSCTALDNVCHNGLARLCS